MRQKPDSGVEETQAPASPATLNQWLSYLESIHPQEIDLGLDRVLLVLRKLFPRKPASRVITVAGTNGKGSTVACLEALLRVAGRTTGAYTSPHLERYNERIRINGVDVDDGSIVAAFEQIEKARGSVSLTYFEFSTLAAFLIMEAHGVDDWILEVGLGGRLDAVNVLDADLAIITSVDIDHTAWLGDNREKIGFEKAGILRFSKPAIYADIDPPNSVLQQAQAQKVPLIRCGIDYHVEPHGERLKLTLADDLDPLMISAGPLPETSVAAAVQALRYLQPDVPNQAIANCLDTVTVPGRFERIHRLPDVYVDVGHNPHAARWLAKRLAKLKTTGRRIFAVYGCLADKDALGVVSALVAQVDHWVLGGLSVPRGLNVKDLAVILEPRLAASDVLQADTISAATDLAMARACDADIVVVFGSFHTVAQARAHLLAV
ncbi:bifunctional tetrahydrofolate synthase/dihydrofolate synthase [Marinobacter caseinilyticus]|uniref:bifunctional tetrahydrofolate synthase/dihydrofolate synthase n=1 Tax=Marinobacter caseinilyticus TaxID=2692195 RepID=UPI00140A5BA3|nr:bifunctional tetrahydrofolate synthase/dihydrofolate synthase [Marinobacter caseinilyticus]